MLTIPDTVEVLTLLVCVALIYARPVTFFFFNILLCSSVGAWYYFSSQAAGDLVPVIRTDLVGGRSHMTAGIYELGASEHDITVSTEVPIPEAHNQKQILLQVKSAGLNPSNYKLHKAKIPFLRWIWVSAMPVIGYDAAGVALSVGSDDECQDFKVGDRVYGFVDGSFAEYALIPCARAAVSAHSLTDAEASALPVAISTSLDALNRGGVEQGTRLLVVGASGGCGSFGVKLAKAKGADVTGICSTRNVDYVQSIGADRIIDYKSKDDMEALKKLQFDVVYDTVTSFAPEDPDYEPILRPLLDEGGKYEAINGARLDWFRGIMDALVEAAIGKRGLLQREGYDLLVTRPSHKNLAEISSMFDSFALKGVDIDSSYPLTYAGINAAFTRMKSRRVVGKIVIDVTQVTDDAPADAPAEATCVKASHMCDAPGDAPANAPADVA